MKEINVTELFIQPVDLWMNRWFLLTAGTMTNFNMMTVSWGTIGCLWNKPVVQIFVRPQRHTFRFTEAFGTFTLCGFPDKYRRDLNILGTLSGRDGNKLEKTSLTIKSSKQVMAPAYEEASIILECQKLYRQRMDPQGFVDKEIHQHYPSQDFHMIYIAEVLAAFMNT